MSLTGAQVLQSLALGQTLMVLPALGDTYEGRTAATIAALMMVLVNEAAASLERRRHGSEALAAMFRRHADAVDDPALATDLRLGTRPGDPHEYLGARFERMMKLLTVFHDWADRAHPAAAAECRAFLSAFHNADVIDPFSLGDGSYAS
ncbi:hypothetical protein [Sandaracinobacteroides saxicola]|uniref:Uncharacterized protein n=1 Tax=Sandaracinobacteroides saxicola TaxID=2759707 RepID=A0A7G5IKF7_9SPHN|nr:hypothetical protein [Sandaracinobacteroides saxicola]QMW23849.1 hypothetical protein H3309_05070 [Sandaracinobacteroides saxicola]